MPFFQEPPRLGNQFDDDPLLPSWLARHIPESHHGEITTEMHQRTAPPWFFLPIVIAGFAPFLLPAAVAWWRGATSRAP